MFVLDGSYKLRALIFCRKVYEIFNIELISLGNTNKVNRSFPEENKSLLKYNIEMEQILMISACRFFRDDNLQVGRQL